ncbi:MAG: bifunctional response regulator/alkaline phosphatase family protein [Bacteroidales bacterium]|nr:bifunctional response regulator/alkaline phosphatase family protein [Bacteroidales bacterium]
MKQIQILWTDDEIDLLKPYIIFLQNKGYQVDTATNGNDAIDLTRKNHYDMIFLDENMPGISGLETLKHIKDALPNTPVIMITKSEEEDIMDEAIGSKISDYLIKPVNPNQILLTIKKHIDKQRLITEKTTSSYQMAFGKLGMKINEVNSISDWYELYRKLVFWEMQLMESNDNTMDEVFEMQMNEANVNFAKFIKRNYISWFDTKCEEKPLLSPNLIREKVFPLLQNGQKVLFLLIDNLRFDQWKTIEPILNQFYTTTSEEMFFSILPTSTQYSRNSIFSGLMPSEINKLYPELWKNDDEEGGKNLYEEEMLASMMKRYNVKCSMFFDKITDIKNCKNITDNIKNIAQNQFISIVVNFVDSLSHAGTEQRMVRELTNTTESYLSITKSWFERSPLFDMLKAFAEQGICLVIGTDHGSIQIANPLKVVGDRATTTNLRYKQGRNLNYNPKEVFEITTPQEAYLPKTNISSTYIFAMNDDFFAYPNNYNQYAKYYKNTFQHGGISLQEMIIPAITMMPK